MTGQWSTIANPISRSVVNMKLQKFWGYNCDRLRLRDVIGHVTVGFAIYGFP